MIVTVKKIRDLKINRITFVAEFAVPLDRDTLDQKGREAVEELLGSPSLAKLTPAPRAKRETDGDWKVTYESSSDAEFKLTLQHAQIGATLKAVEDHQESLDLLKLHARIGLSQLSVRAVTSLFLRFENQFVLGEGTNNKGLLIEKVLASSEHSPFGKLRERTVEMGRFDLKFNLKYKNKYNVFYTLELPSNRNHRTVWMEMAVVTREDTRIDASEAEVSGIIDSAYELYCTSYAEYLEKLLVEQDVTYLV